MPSPGCFFRPQAPAASGARRGSVLLTAAVFAALIAIALTSFIKLAVTSMTMADRSCYHSAAVNLSELGVEEALYSYNLLNDVPKTSPQDAWVPYGWAISATDNKTVTRTLSGFTPGPGAAATVKVSCSMYNPTSLTDKPVVTSQAVVTMPDGSTTSKFVQVQLRKRSLFPRGMVVRHQITANGNNLSLDSWDSGDDGLPTTAGTPYSMAVRKANASVATTNPADGAIDIGNGDVFGYIYTAGGNVTKGTNAALNGTFTTNVWDDERVSKDYDVQNFPVMSPNTPAGKIAITSSITSATTFPRSGDTAVNGVYWYEFAPGVNVNLNSAVIQVAGNVVFVLNNHAGTPAIDIHGVNSGINIALSATLKVYTNGNVTVGSTGSSSGLSNGNSKPSTCVFYGTNTTAGGQTFTLVGNGTTAISLYAPNAGVTVSGGGSGGDFFGALVGYDVVLNGTIRYHYDEALARLYTGEPFGIDQWLELRTAADRAAGAALLNF